MRARARIRLAHPPPPPPPPPASVHTDTHPRLEKRVHGRVSGRPRRWAPVREAEARRDGTCALCCRAAFSLSPALRARLLRRCAELGQPSTAARLRAFARRQAACHLHAARATRFFFCAARAVCRARARWRAALRRVGWSLGVMGACAAAASRSGSLQRAQSCARGRDGGRRQKESPLAKRGVREKKAAGGEEERERVL